LELSGIEPLNANAGRARYACPGRAPDRPGHGCRTADRRTRIGCHTFRSTGITYLKNKGTLEHVQAIANRASLRRTKLYDRRSDEVSLSEVEKIAI
jgi:hypothetical protein